MLGDRGRTGAQAIGVGVVLLLVAGCLTAFPASVTGPPPAAAQSGKKPVRIGVLWAREAVPEQQQALEEGLRDLGWVKGDTMVLEYRFAEGVLERLPALAAEFVDRRVDLIIAVAAPETAAARQATKTIPIVFVVHGDPVGSGAVATLAHPGGNATGLAQMAPEVATKQLELLKQAVPRVSRVAVIWNAANPTKVADWREVSAAAQRLGIALQSREVRRGADFAGAFAAIRRERPDALMTLADPVTIATRAAIVDFAAKERLPAMYALRLFVDAGGLMSYGADLTELFRRAPRFVDKILRGARPGDLPVEQATKFEMVLNARAAKALGLVIPPALQLRVDHLVQ